MALQERAVSSANSRALMQGCHIVFLVKNVLPNKYHLVLATCQGLGDELGVSRTALPWTVSSRALETHSCRMTEGWLLLSYVSPENSGGWLLCDGLVVLYSLFHSMQKGAISENSWDEQTAHVLPACVLFYWETRLVLFSSFCSAHSWWFSADISPKWPC